MRISKIMMVVVLFVAAVGATFVSSAAAQDTGVCGTYNNPACTLDSPNLGKADAPDDLTDNLSSNFSTGGGPSADVIPAQPTPVPAAAATDTEAPQLAFTGNESSALAYVGTGLIGFGALALVARRRLSTDA